MTDQPTERELKPFRSYALWPEGTPADSGNLSWHFHETREQAVAICGLLKQHGFGGNGKVFPIKTWVEDHSHDSCPAETELQSLRSEVERLGRERKELVEMIQKAELEACIDQSDDETELWRMVESFFARARGIWSEKVDTLKAENAELVKALEAQHRWHLDQTDRTPVYFGDTIGQVNADEYADSELCEQTQTALAKTGGAK